MDDHDDIEFDIEGMTFEPSQGIASSSASQIQDGGAVISAAEEVMLQKKKSDPRFRTQVCSFWIEGRCMKGETCEFLHRYDTDKMPACRFGENCHIKDCPFRHVKEEDKPECILYKQGFCPHGPYCKYRHAKHGPAELPEEAPFLLRGYHGNNQDGGQPGGGGRGGYHHDPARQARRHEFFKVSLCKNWEKTGTCPFGDRCHFAHGAAELRRPPAAAPGGGATEFPVQPGGGFVFGCNARTMDECMAKMLFGLPANMEALLAQHVRPGAPLFLHNLTSKQMFGVFAAASAPALNLDPAAWARPAVARLGAAVASSSPFPCQVRVVLQLTCPPVPEYDPGLQAILRQRPKMIGPVTEEQAQQLANLFALYGGHIQKNPINIKGGPKQGGWYEPRNPYFQKIFVRMQSHPGFNVSAKLVGKNGDQVKTIMNECQGNTRLRLRGRGSTYREGPAQVEAPEELHFLVSAAEVGAMAEAVRRTEELVEKIREEYLEFLESPAAQAAGPIPLPPVPFPPMGLPPGAGGFPPRGMGLPPPGMLPPGFLPPGGPMGGFLPPRGPRGLPPF